jgi:peptide/nickel transport system substrate-binding protein
VRKEQYWEAQKLLQDDGGAIVAHVGELHSRPFASRLAHDEKPSLPTGISDGNKVAERWWFA